jgi:hypothetical protein
VKPLYRPSVVRWRSELRSLNWPGARLRVVRGRKLHFSFKIAPTPFARVYDCQLNLYDDKSPEVLVLSPDLTLLAEGRSLPHVYQHDGPGTKLCLWLPREKEWTPAMRLDETYLPWTAQWLDYFEEWLVTDVWSGGGAHPTVLAAPRQPPKGNPVRDRGRHEPGRRPKVAKTARTNGTLSTKVD